MIHSKALFLSAICLVLGCDHNHKLLDKKEYIKEIVFRTRPASPPYFFPLTRHGHWGADFKPTANIDSLKASFNHRYRTQYDSPALGYFWALNCDELAFINRSEGRIYLLDLRSKKYRDFKPEVGRHNQLRFFWVGPEDEIYASLMPYQYDQPYADYKAGLDMKLFRLERNEGCYCYDDRSLFPSGIGAPDMIRISPLNNLFISGWGKSIGGSSKTIFDRTGTLIGRTRADCENLCGEQFMITKSWNRSFCMIRARMIDDNRCILTEEIEYLSTAANFKYTLNNKLIVYCHHDSLIRLDSGCSLSVNIPVLFGKDFDTGRQFLIDLGNMGLDEFRFYSISDISINYGGDIYAMVVYYNEPGAISGDELIVLYRWRMKYL